MLEETDQQHYTPRNGSKNNQARPSGLTAAGYYYYTDMRLHEMKTTKQMRRRVTARQVSDYLMGLMHLHGISQRELGRLSGVDQKTISNLCREVSLPRVETMDLLVAPFGVECWEALYPGAVDKEDLRGLVQAYEGASEERRAAVLSLLRG